MAILLPRHYGNLDTFMHAARVTVIYGLRRVGKTTLVSEYIARAKGRHLSVVGDDMRVRKILSSQDLRSITQWAEGYDLIFIDEAQRIPEVGWALKLLIDSNPTLTVIACGSASLELAGAVGEPLTGRQTPLMLYPIAVSELHALPMNTFQLRENLPEYLVYGMYPEVVRTSSIKERKFILEELTASYLYKDILEL